MGRRTGPGPLRAMAPCRPIEHQTQRRRIESKRADPVPRKRRSVLLAAFAVQRRRRTGGQGFPRAEEPVDGGIDAPGAPCHARTVAQVVESRIEGLEPGDFVFNTNGWAEYGLMGEGVARPAYMVPRKLDPAKGKISQAVGVLAGLVFNFTLSRKLVFKGRA